MHNLARFVSIAKFRPLTWRINHPYLLADRFEDVTPPDRIHQDPKCDRNVTIYGYLRGSNLKRDMKVRTPFHMCFSYHHLSFVYNGCLISIRGVRCGHGYFYVILKVDVGISPNYES